MPSPPVNLLGELQAVAEVPRLLARSRSLSRAPRGDGGPVVLFPGFGTDDHVLFPLRRFLRSIGHDARGWSLGRNDGNVMAKLPSAIDRVRALATSAGRPVAVVGWSLGGVFAREVARDAPQLVRCVVTMGTPLNGPPASVAARAYAPETIRLIRAEIAKRDQRPIRQPITALYSRRDRIVPWESCIDRRSPDVDNIEIKSTHVGMGIDPDVWQLVADRIAH